MVSVHVPVVSFPLEDFLGITCFTEKFDAISRDWRDNLFLLGSIRLVMVDEVRLGGVYI